MRKLTDAPYLANLPLANIRLMPKKLPLLTARDAQGGAGNCYLVGFDVDKERMQGNELHITAKVEAFTREFCACSSSCSASSSTTSSG